MAIPPKPFNPFVRTTAYMTAIKSPDARCQDFYSKYKSKGKDIVWTFSNVIKIIPELPGAFEREYLLILMITN